MADNPVKNYLEVAVTAPVKRLLTYLPPEDYQGTIMPGMRVLVPLSGRKITGYVLARVAAAPEGQQIKRVYEVLDSKPLFHARQGNFFRWIANYYHYPIGEVIKTALPAGLTKRSGRRVLLTEAGKKHLAELPESAITASPWFAGLLRKGEISPHVTGRLWRAKERRHLESWEKEGWIEISSELVGGTAKIKTEICCGLAENSAARGPLKISEQKTLDLLQRIAAETHRRFVPRKEITRQYSGAGQGLKSLVQKNIVLVREQQVYRDPFGECFLESDIPENLTAEQNRALKHIVPALEKETFTPFLLHGVTGSGKTEVYLQAAATALELGKSVLVLVPEIALATQLEAHFIARFGTRVALLHSGLSSGQRFDQWRRIVQGEADVVIGARSAVFAPLAEPGLIIVDEEHDSSYKQDDGFRYHARDLAVLRASQSPAVVILGSATPAVTSYYHAGMGKYTLLELDKRIEERPLPLVEVVDMQSVRTVSGRPPVFSPLFVRDLRENFARGEQSLVFLNRRGYANFMICRDCGTTVQCRHCQVSLTLHRSKNKLLCHYCGFTSSSNILCANCKSSSMTAIGIGTERLEHELAELLPGARIARLDRDTCKSRKDYIKILQDVHKGNVDILLGTQMITKGHHFPNVTLVGIVLADTGLGLPDFRAGERTFQLISQVTGRAGRGEKPGRVIVQTFQPDHYSIAMAKNHDYTGMYAKEIEMRKVLSYPPFSRLVNVRVEGREDAYVQEVAARIANLARKNQQSAGLEILGPAPAPLTRLRDKYRWQLLIKGARIKVLHSLLLRLEGEIDSLNRAAGVKVSIDIDPEYMM